MKETPDLMDIIKRTINKIVDLIVLSDYKMPAVQGKTDYEMDWASGTSGAITLFAEAMETFPDIRIRLLNVM